MKLKWKYDKKFKQWWVDLGLYEYGGFMIEKDGSYYALIRDDSRGRIGSFRLLKNAKTVAQLLHNG